MRSSYKEQYIFGHGPFELKNLDDDTPAPSYLGENRGGQAALDDGTHGNVSGYTLPIDLRADRQMAYHKARFTVSVLETLAGSGAAAKVVLGTCAATSAGVPDIAHTVELLSFNVSTAGTPAASSKALMEMTMPSNTKEYVFVSIILADKTKTFTAGKLLIQMNPNF